MTDGSPARYAVRINHRRRDPIDYGFSQRGGSWLVDLDRLPELPGPFRRLARFDAADHLGDPGRTLRQNLDGLLAEHGRPAPARVLMLANPRVLGYVFNPLTVFYCYDAAGRLTGTVAEVHNTYRGRHAYLVDPDEHGRASVAKAFYVSPFYPVDGEYRMRLPEPAETLSLAVTLHRPGDRPFTATVTGHRAGPARSLWPALRTPLATRAVMLGIRRHGITLYLKGLRPYPRPKPAATAEPPAAAPTAAGLTAELRKVR